MLINSCLRVCANICHIPAKSKAFGALVTEADNISNNKTDNQEPNAKSLQSNMDEFTREFLKNQIELSTFQKVLLSSGSSIAALLNPKRHDMIACLGETTGKQALINILQTMKASEEGQRILKEKPRINTRTVDIERLNQLPENTFGRAYVKFLHDNQVTPDSRMPVRFMDDAELAYIMTRYRECHDLVHTLLDMPTNMLGEVAVKWFEALNNGLPMCYGGAIFGALRLKSKQRKLYLRDYLPWAIQNGKNAKPLMPIYWEERWHQNIHDMRRELQITPLIINKVEN